MVFTRMMATPIEMVSIFWKLICGDFTRDSNSRCHKYLKGRFIFPKYVFYYNTSNRIICTTFEVHVYVDKVLFHIKNWS